MFKKRKLTVNLPIVSFPASGMLFSSPFPSKRLPSWVLSYNTIIHPEAPLRLQSPVFISATSLSPLSGIPCSFFATGDCNVRRVEGGCCWSGGGGLHLRHEARYRLHRRRRLPFLGVRPRPSRVYRCKCFSSGELGRDIHEELFSTLASRLKENDACSGPSLHRCTHISSRYCSPNYFKQQVTICFAVPENTSLRMYLGAIMNLKWVEEAVSADSCILL